MESLTVENKNGILVVDSRLVAEELGISHKTLKDTITKHKEKLETLVLESLKPDVGASRHRLYKESSPKHSDGTGGEVYYLLTEEQAIFLMTLSANTDKVIEAKYSLVKAFKIAKNTLLSLEPKLPTELLDLFKNMQQEMQVLSARTQRLDEIDKAGEIHKGCSNIIKAECDQDNEDELVTAFRYLKLKGFGYEQANKLARRAANFSRIGKGNKYEPPKDKNGHLLFETKYLDEALKSICNF